MPCLRLGRHIRFDWRAVINWPTAAWTQEKMQRGQVFRRNAGWYVSYYQNERRSAVVSASASRGIPKKDVLPLAG
jgi:hypothetical protein